MLETVTVVEKVVVVAEVAVKGARVMAVKLVVGEADVVIVVEAVVVREAV